MRALRLAVPAVLLCAACAPPLMKAAREGDVDAARSLLASGADPNIRSEQETPLLAAVSAGHLPVATLLLDKGAKVDGASRWGQTPLMRAARARRLDAARALLDRGADVKARDAHDATPLHYAVEGGDPDVVRLLLDRGADINASDKTSYGGTPLGLTAYFGEADIAKLLIERGADPRKPGNNDKSPASQALWRGNFELSRMLRDAAEGKKPAAAPATKPAPEPPAPADVPAYQLPEDPHAFAVVVGIGDYASLSPAPYAERDAQAVSAHLKALGYLEKNVIALSGIQTTKAGLVKTFEGRLPGAVGPDATVFVYFAGLGSTDKAGRTYLVPMDGDPEFLADTAYPVQRLFDELAGLRAKRIVVVLDCSFSDKGARFVAGAGAKGPVPSIPSSAPKVVAVMPAVGEPGDGMLSDVRHGAMTYRFLQSLPSGFPR